MNKINKIFKRKPGDKKKFCPTKTFPNLKKSYFLRFVFA